MLRTRQALITALLSALSGLALAALAGYLDSFASPDWHLVGALVMGFSAYLIGSALYLGFRAFIKVRRVRRFRERGRRLLARVLRVEHTISRDQEDSFRLILESTDTKTGQPIQIRSEPLAEYPGDGIEGSNVDVLVDPENPKQTLVDTRPFKKKGHVA
jgi:hypothetical protein